MWKATKYLYYKLYKLFIRINGPKDLPEITASIGVGTLFCFNFLALIAIVDVFFPIWDFQAIPRGKFFILFGIPYILILYFSFVFNGKYKRIINEFKNENEKQRKKGKMFVVTYFVLTVIFQFFSIVLMIMKEKGMF